ncbi:MAG: 2-hydroxychromene-2-carboxylate isomerase [Deltaproteobacteria bacterium]|nr:2-hydroxychromene-2-carboxylate isomerase [Deltaproteobacteria bacterium]
MPTPVRFHFDYLSPYAYVAWTQIHRVVESRGRAVAPVPVLFAGLLDAHGQKGPAEIPSKRVYAFKDAYRKAHRLGLPPLTPPSSHPYNPLLSLRISSLELDPATVRRIADAFFAAVWQRGIAIDVPEVVAPILAELGLDAADLIARANAPDTKDRLRRNTETAIAAGVFGVPTALADGEIFWGVDSLELLDDYLAGRDPLPADVAHRWANLPSTATRRRP